MKLKNPKQIQHIADSGAILARTLRTLGASLEPGMTGLDVDAECRRLLAAEGARPAFLGYEGYPSSICVSINDQVIHGIPSRIPFEDGDVVSLDLGVDLGGFISDSASTFPIGEIAQEVSRLCEATRGALEAGIAAARPGGRVQDISRAVFEYVQPHGYGVVRPFCGHGVGFDVHEEPQVPNYVSRGPNPRLKPGMVLAIEPMINLGGDDVYILDDDWTVVTSDGSVSAHYEHTIAVTEEGIRILTLEHQSMEVA